MAYGHDSSHSLFQFPIQFNFAFSHLAVWMYSVLLNLMRQRIQRIPSHNYFCVQRLFVHKFEFSWILLLLLLLLLVVISTSFAFKFLNETIILPFVTIQQQRRRLVSIVVAKCLNHEVQCTWWQWYIQIHGPGIGQCAPNVICCWITQFRSSYAAIRYDCSTASAAAAALNRRIGGGRRRSVRGPTSSSS